MPKSVQRSLHHEYELYVENEIEAYKDSLPRSALLKIGDEAVAALREQAQLALTELVVWEEVDRIIRKRLRIPAYSTWRRKRIKLIQEYQRPEHWGLRPDCVLAREVKPPAESNVLVTGTVSQPAALYLAAHGCEVFAVDQTRDVVERVVTAAEAAGLTDRVHGYIADLRQWPADVRLNAVVCSLNTFHGLSEDERGEVIRLLQDATHEGGVHLHDVEPDTSATAMLQELSAQYKGWKISVEQSGGLSTSFLARKGAA
jgi:predicted Fe-Mo cluster-binding NifX family protein